MQRNIWGWKWQKYSIVEKADLILKKDMKHGKKNKRKRKPEKWESTVWKAMEINIDLRLDVDEQQGDNIFTVKSDIDDTDEV